MNSSFFVVNFANCIKHLSFLLILMNSQLISNWTTSSLTQICVNCKICQEFRSHVKKLNFMFAFVSRANCFRINKFFANRPLAHLCPNFKNGDAFRNMPCRLKSRLSFFWRSASLFLCKEKAANSDIKNSKRLIHKRTEREKDFSRELTFKFKKEFLWKILFAYGIINRQWNEKLLSFQARIPT